VWSQFGIAGVGADCWGEGGLYGSFGRARVGETYLTPVSLQFQTLPKVQGRLIAFISLILLLTDLGKFLGEGARGSGPGPTSSLVGTPGRDVGHEDVVRARPTDCPLTGGS
jgi:hypothetical protein